MTLPENILNKMSLKDRAKLGKSGRTYSEVVQESEIRNESDLQKQVRQLLNLNCCAILQAPQGRASRLPKGWPDFTFAIRGQACAIECKTATGVLSPDQSETLSKLTQDGWRVCVARNLNDAANFIRDLHR